MTKLREASKVADEPSSGKLRGEILGLRVFVDVVVPRTQIKGRMRLLTRDEVLTIRAEILEAFEAKGLPVDQATLHGLLVHEWNAEYAIRVVALAVRDPDDVEQPLDTIAEWRTCCDDEQVMPLWDRYQDLVGELDPMSDLGALSDDQFNAIRSAAKKKEGALLMSYGSRKLAAFAITSAAPPPS